MKVLQIWKEITSLKITVALFFLSKSLCWHSMVLSLSLSIPLYLVGLFLLRLWLYYYSIFLSFSDQVFSHTSATTVCFWGSLFLKVLTISSCVLVHCHPSSPATGAYSFLRARWDFMYVQFYVCLIREDHSQGYCSRIKTRSWNQTFAPMQALDHKSNSLPQG